MIHRFDIEYFKALRSVSLALTPFHVLIGPNDSGKTSILDAMAAVCRSVDFPLDKCFEGTWRGRELVFQGMDHPVGFEVQLDENVHYRLEVDFHGFDEGARVARLFKEVLSGESVALPKSPYPDKYRHSSAVFEANHQGLALEEPVRQQAIKIHRLLSGVHVCRWMPRLLGLPCAADTSMQFRLNSLGFGLAWLLDQILGFDRQRFDLIEARFREFFPSVKSIKLLPSHAFRAKEDSHQDFPILEEAEGKGLSFQMSHQRQLVPASEISDGLLLVLAYLTILNLPEPPRLLLIEEPENGIHPGILKEVLQILKDVVGKQNRTQILMTTHSPYVVDLFKPEEVTLCHKDTNGEVHVRQLSESAKIREQIDIFTLGEIWTGEGDEALAKGAVGSK